MKNGEKMQGEGLQELKMRKELSYRIGRDARSYSKGSSSSKGSPGSVIFVFT